MLIIEQIMSTADNNHKQIPRGDNINAYEHALI
jgi:hypothetical protein